VLDAKRNQEAWERRYLERRRQSNGSAAHAAHAAS